MIWPVLNPDDDFYIKAPKYNNNFWCYVHQNSHTDGSMVALEPGKIGRLLGLNQGSFHHMSVQAEEQFKDVVLMDLEDHTEEYGYDEILGTCEVYDDNMDEPQNTELD